VRRRRITSRARVGKRQLSRSRGRRARARDLPTTPTCRRRENGVRHRLVSRPKGAESVTSPHAANAGFAGARLADFGQKQNRPTSSCCGAEQRTWVDDGAYRDRTGDLRLAKPREWRNGRRRPRTGCVVTRMGSWVSPHEPRTPTESASIASCSGKQKTLRKLVQPIRKSLDRSRAANSIRSRNIGVSAVFDVLRIVLLHRRGSRSRQNRGDALRGARKRGPLCNIRTASRRSS
jgi:hypothetical protein